MKKYIVILMFIITNLFLFVGCGNYYVAEVTLRSEPPGARIYDSKYNKLLGRVPIELEFEMDEDEYYGQSTWNCGTVTAYLDGYQSKTQDIILNTSNFEYFGFWDGRKKQYNYNILIRFDTPESQQINNTGLVFYTANTGNDNNPRDAFSTNESIDIVLKGYSGKTVELYIKNISNGNTVFQKTFYIPSDWRGFNSPVGNLSSGSYVLVGIIDGKTRLDDYRFLIR